MEILEEFTPMSLIAANTSLQYYEHGQPIVERTAFQLLEDSDALVKIARHYRDRGEAEKSHLAIRQAHFIHYVIGGGNCGRMQ
jgi:hypothetical protein